MLLEIWKIKIKTNNNNFTAMRHNKCVGYLHDNVRNDLELKQK